MDVLIIDDDEQVRRLLRYVLEQQAHTVAEAPDGLRALDLIGANRSDVAFVDLFMPGMDGLELIPKLHIQSPLTKIVAMSGGIEGRALDLLRVAQRLGATKALAKPFTAAEVRQVMLELGAEAQ
jgi:two-component system response regulator (stage 0 sporulation protein F)